MRMPRWVFVCVSLIVLSALFPSVACSQVIHEIYIVPSAPTASPGDCCEGLRPGARYSFLRRDDRRPLRSVLERAAVPVQRSRQAVRSTLQDLRQRLQNLCDRDAHPATTVPCPDPAPMAPPGYVEVVQEVAVELERLDAALAAQEAAITQQPTLAPPPITYNAAGTPQPIVATEEPAEEPTLAPSLIVPQP